MGLKLLLNGQWKYREDPDEEGSKNNFQAVSFNDSLWKNMDVPSNWETAGLPGYSGVVWFRKKIEINKIHKNANYQLVFYGVDYFAEVYLNGKQIISHEGYFQPFNADITDMVKAGSNIIAVKVTCPIEKSSAWPFRKRYIKGVFGHHDVRPGSWSREFGQDKPTGGIWNNVEINIYPKVYIDKFKIKPKLNSNKSEAEVNVELIIQNYSNKKTVVNIDLACQLMASQSKPIKFKYPINLFSGENVIELSFPIPNPKLWWTWDQGEPNLYNLKIDLSCNDSEIKLQNSNYCGTWESNFGIRQIKIDDNKVWYLNGRKIFIRGSNVIPEEYLSSYSKERIENDIKLAKAANINALRVHAHVNRKEFYEACDKTGIMVWQDFALQWEYEQSVEFWDQAVSQIKDMVNWLYHHPSIVLWCCHNEPIKSKKTLDPKLYQAVLQEDNTREVFTSSDFSHHPYPGWFNGDVEHYASLPGKPLITEFGAQALPNQLTLEKMFFPDQLWPPDWKIWAYHDFAYEQTFHVAQINMGNSIEEFVNNSQAYQANLIKFAIENYRRHKWSQVSGIFHFMLLEPWPAISYAVLDYFRHPKKGYHALSMAYQPVLCVFVPERKICSINDRLRGSFFMINDYNQNYNNVVLKMNLLRNGEPIFAFADINLDLVPNSCNDITNEVYSKGCDLKIPAEIAPGEVTLLIEIESADNETISRNQYSLKLDKTPVEIMEFGAVFEWE